MGLPIIATDIRGCRQVVRDGVNGLLIPVGQSSAIRNAILALGGDPGRRREMSLASRQIAAAEFDERRVVSIVIDTYKEILEAKGYGDLIPSLWLTGTGPE